MYDAETVRVREVCCLVISVPINLVDLYIYNGWVLWQQHPSFASSDAGGAGQGRGEDGGGLSKGGVLERQGLLSSHLSILIYLIYLIYLINLFNGRVI